MIKTLNLTLNKHISKRYLQIADALRTAIKNGHVVESERLPSARELATQLSVNRHTVMAAYQELVAQGWVDTRQRQGYSVAKNLPIISSVTHSSPVFNNAALTTNTRVKSLPNVKVKTNQLTHKHQWCLAKPQIISVKPNKPASQYQYNFAGGNPDIDLFPFKEFKSMMNDSLNRPSIKDLNYGDNNGFQPFIEQVSTYLRRVRSLKNKELVVVNGTQEALYILSQVLLKKGDKVAVESLGYRPAWQAFENAGAELIGVNQLDSSSQVSSTQQNTSNENNSTTEAGIDVIHLEQLFKAHKIKLLYLTPLHQYPTTTTLPVAQRLKIYQLAQQYQVPIIEDDYDHEFHYNSQPLAPMAATDPSGLIIYLSSFSKIMFPGIRLGVIAVEKSLAQHLVQYRTLINHKANVVLQDAVARWMKEGGFERHLRKTTRIYQKRRQCMVNCLTEYKHQGLVVDFVVPAGGMALWVNVGHNAEALAQAAENNDIYLLPESVFHLKPDSRLNKNQFIRLGFAGQSEQKIKQGLAKLMDILKSLSPNSLPN